MQEFILTLLHSAPTTYAPILFTQGPILDSEISVGEISLTPGNWEVFWYATLDTVQTDPINPQNATGQSVTTCPSASCSFLVVGK